MSKKARIKTWFPKLKNYQKKLDLLPKGSVQKFIDNQIIKLSDSYVPSDTTYIRKSVYINTDIGSGTLTYDIYGNVPGRNTWNDETSRFQGSPRRGPYWVLRMWADGGKEKIMKMVNRLFGGK